MGKGEIAHFEQFHLLPQCFPTAFFLKVLKWVYIYIYEGIDCIVFNVIYNSISVISRQPVHLSMLSWNSHNILSKPLTAFPHNHCRNNEQQWERNKSCHNDYHQSSERILAEQGIEPPVLKSATVPNELCGSASLYEEKGLVINSNVSDDFYKLTLILPNFTLLTNRFFSVNPFPNKPWILRVCSASLLKTLWEKEKLLVTSNFSFSHSVFYLFGELSAIFIKFEIVVCQLFQFGSIENLSFG